MMKLVELMTGHAISEFALMVGGGGPAVGNAGAETMMLKGKERENIPHRRVQRPPQPGYSIKIGNRRIPTPMDQSDNELGVVNSVRGG